MNKDKNPKSYENRKRYRETHREEAKRWSNEWRKRNRDKYLVYSREYRKLNCERRGISLDVYKDKLCLVCNKLFTPISYRSKCCSRKCRRKNEKKTPKKRFNIYKNKSRLRGYEFNLDYDFFVEMVGKECFYCGQKFPQMGLDRQDNRIGYIISNVVTCCKVCNRLKNVLSSRSFIRICKIVAEKHKDEPF